MPGKKLLQNQNFYKELFEEGTRLLSEKKYKEALEKFHEVVKKNIKPYLAPAQYNIGVCYLEGRGVKKNPKEAFYLFRLAAKNGSSEAEFQLGLKCFKKKKWELAFEWFKKSDDKGHLLSEFYLAEMYALGNGTKQNYEEALRYYKKVIDNNSVLSLEIEKECKLLAPIRYGTILFMENENLELAFNYLNSSLTNAPKEEQSTIKKTVAYMCEKGIGTEIDLSKAQKLNNEITSNDDVSKSYYQVAEYLYKVFKEETDKNKKADLGREIIDKLLKAAKSNDPDALFKLAAFYINGVLVKKDVKKAVDLTTKAILIGHGQATDLFFSMLSSLEVIKDIEKDADSSKKVIWLLKWITKNKNLDHLAPEALFNLAASYATGRFVEKDIKQAIYFAKDAALKGHKEAAIQLCKILFLGEAKDINNIIDEAKKSADNGNKAAENLYKQILDNAENIREAVSLLNFFKGLKKAPEKEETLLDNKIIGENAELVLKKYK